MEHKKIVHVKATTRPRVPTKPEDCKASTTQPMYINTEFVTIYITAPSYEQCCQLELATENVERSLFETYGMSSLDLRADTTYILPNFRRDLVMKISLKHLPVLLEEYAKKYYYFEYDVVFDYGASADVAGKDKGHYATVARIDRKEVGEEAFKLFANMYIGENADISDIGYIQIQAPVVEYGK